MSVADSKPFWRKVGCCNIVPTQLPNSECGVRVEQLAYPWGGMLEEPVLLWCSFLANVLIVSHFSCRCFIQAVV